MSSKGEKTYSSLLLCLGTTTLESVEMSLALETLRSNKTLDLRGLGVGLCTLLLGLDFTADNKLADLVIEELVSDCTSYRRQWR